MSRARLQRVALLLVITPLMACDGDIQLFEQGLPDSTPADTATDSVIVDAPEDERPDAKPDVPSGCKTDPECKLSTLHCYAPTGTCVACTEDKHCTEDRLRRCDTAAHRCVECGVPSDCGDSDETCEPTTHKCVHKCGFCFFPSSCDTARGICVSCTKDAECFDDDRRTCEIASGRCVRCISDAQCTGSDDAHCDPVINRCVKCVSATDCPTDKPFCDPIKRECVSS